MTMTNILVIDDEEAIREAFILAFEGSNIQVTGAACGEEGFELFKQGSYSLVYLDLKMPGINGVETLTRLRQINEVVPVYIITAFSQEFLAELLVAKDKGLSFELLKKPLGAAQIVEITENILNINGSHILEAPEQSNITKLKIYAAGITPDTQSAIVTFKQALKSSIKGEISITIINILEHPELTADQDIVATPTLVRVLPEPVKKLILDLNDQEKFSVAVEMMKS